MAILKSLGWGILTVSLVLITAPTGWAQGMGHGGWAGFGPPPPALAAKFQAWGNWRDAHPDVMTLQQTLANLDGLEQGPKGAMTKTQAKRALAIIDTWKTKTAITNVQARRINSQLLAPLTFDQFKVMAAAPQDFGEGRGPGGPGGRPPLDPASFPNPRDYNPLNPATVPLPRQRDRAKQSVSELIAALKAAAK